MPSDVPPSGRPISDAQWEGPLAWSTQVHVWPGGGHLASTPSCSMAPTNRGQERVGALGGWRRDWLPFSNPAFPRLTGNQPVLGRTPLALWQGAGVHQHFSDKKAAAQRGSDAIALHHTSGSLVILGQS